MHLENLDGESGLESSASFARGGVPSTTMSRALAPFLIFPLFPFP